MFQIKNSQENHMQFLTLQNHDGSTYVKVCLHQGARIQEYYCNNTPIIKDIAGFDYKTSYASSILFPFANRINKGKYVFLGEELQFDKNEDNINALHGLVFDKYFEVFEPEENKNNCSVTFNYFEKNKIKSFPYTYFVSVTYTLYADKLNVRITTKNIDANPFPFTLGWHPYFYSSDLKNSKVAFKAQKKVLFDDNLITKELVANSYEDSFSIDDKMLDDCFLLTDNTVNFTTPNYDAKLVCHHKENFLQLFTPKDLSIIAIEPMTGISDSFNNKIGLKVLEPNETFVINWNVFITTK